MTTLSWLLVAIVTAIWLGMLAAVWYAAAVMRTRGRVTVSASARDRRPIHP